MKETNEDSEGNGSEPSILATEKPDVHAQQVQQDKRKYLPIEDHNISWQEFEKLVWTEDRQ